MTLFTVKLLSIRGVSTLANNNHNIYQLFASRFPADRSSAFIENEQGQIWTYADLEAESARFAAYLTGLGVKPGDRVAVQVDKSPQCLFLYLACLRAGLIYLPLNKPREKFCDLRRCPGICCPIQRMVFHQMWYPFPFYSRDMKDGGSDSLSYKIRLIFR